MLKNFSKIMFLSMMIIGSLIAISSNSWITTWLGLEINLISFISLMTYKKKISSTEASLIYFIIQAMASTIFLYSIIMFMFSNFMTNSLIYNYSNYLISLALMIKLGAAPMHFWLPLVMTNINWMNNYLIMTWQKLAPMILLLYCNNIFNNLILLFVIMSSIIGSVGGFNQVNLKKLMAYSSINYISWLLMALVININLWKLFFFMYFYLSLCMVIIFNIFNLTFLNQLFFFNQKNLKINLLIFTNIFSMGGLPPFLGFLPKMMVIIYLIKNNFYFITLIMVMFNLITLYYYLRISYSTFLMNFIKNKSMSNKNLTNKKTKFSNFLFNLLINFSYITNIMLPIISMIFYLNI